jgi:hypothetical protein
MSAIEWTEEQPTEEGWYWVRLKDANWINDKCETIGYIRTHYYEDLSPTGELFLYICGCEYGIELTRATHFSRIE